MQIDNQYSSKKDFFLLFFTLINQLTSLICKTKEELLLFFLFLELLPLTATITINEQMNKQINKNQKVSSDFIILHLTFFN